MMKINVLLLSTVMMVAFQNCSSSNSNYSQKDNGSSYPEGSQAPLNPGEPGLQPQEPSPSQKFFVEKQKCIFKLEGEAGWRWSVERFTNAGGDCSDFDSMIAEANPRAIVVESESRYVYDPVTNSSKWKWQFDFVGPNGFEWTTERYTEERANCREVELPIVEENNPRASVSLSTVFVKDPIGSGSKHKCVYEMVGDQSATWRSLRYVADSEECKTSELDFVEANNPLASVSLEAIIFTTDIW